ncbi:MAG TPA: LPS export ABC transporter permease LptF [Cellvibrio sp.]|nr:LPS export ABC transporter permease LptF [Cellvibrio sp.]
MIILRYLSRDILINAFAVSLVLLLIILSGRFVGLLADAAAGKYAVDVLFTMIGYRMPGLLQVILPLGFFIAVLLAYGRLYIESEMVVLFACGISQRQLMAITLLPALLMAVLVALFSFWLGPVGAQQYAKVLDEQRNRSEFETLNAGRFQALGQGQTMTYIDDITNKRKRLEGVFIAHEGSDKYHLMVAVAKYGEQVQHPEYEQRYLMLHEGDRYEGMPGSAEFRVTHFSTYGQYMPPAETLGDYTRETDAKPTSDLFSSADRELQTALQWRLSMPMLVFIGALLAVPLSRSNPRQGRFLKMLPALLLYIFYFTFLGNVRSAMESGKWPLFPGLWAVHGAFALLALLLFNWEKVSLWQSRRAAEKRLAAEKAGEKNTHA